MMTLSSLAIHYNIFQKAFESENVAPFQLTLQAARAQVSFLKYVVAI